MSTEQQSQLPDRERMVQVVTAEQNYVKAQSYAQSLREKASKISNKEEREKMIKEAYEKEVEAHGHSAYARRLQSGAWQGGAAGGGIGLASGAGLGTLVGTLVGGLVSIPTTGLGILIGAGVGAAHGPWIKLGGKKKKFEDASPEEIVDAIEQERVQSHQASEQQVGMPAESGNDLRLPTAEHVASRAKRKPRKIEIRSQKDKEAVEPGTETNDTTATGKHRPRKLQPRSGVKANDIFLQSNVGESHGSSNSTIATA